MSSYGFFRYDETMDTYVQFDVQSSYKFFRYDETLNTYAQFDVPNGTNISTLMKTPFRFTYINPGDKGIKHPGQTGNRSFEKLMPNHSVFIVGSKEFQELYLDGAHFFIRDGTYNHNLDGLLPEAMKFLDSTHYHPEIIVGSKEFQTYLKNFFL